MTALEERMKKTVLGQVTWAEPEMNARCAACAYWAEKRTVKGVRLGVCKLVKVHSPEMNTVAFAGQDAIACPKFLRRPVVGGAQ